jgi:hypothetical protein
MSNQLKMDELISNLTNDPNARKEWLEVAKRLEAKYPQDKAVKETKSPGKALKVAARTSDADCCRLLYDDGYSLCFTSEGNMFIENATDQASKSAKTIQENYPSVFQTFMENHLLDLEDMMFVVNHTGYMFSREAVKGFDRHKAVVAKSVQKTQYINKDNKRAFMAGLVCGRLG